MYFLQQKSRLYLLQFSRKSCTKMCLDLVLNAENQPQDRQFPRIYRVFWWKCSVINPKLLFAGLFWKKCINKKSSFGCYRGALTEWKSADVIERPFKLLRHPVNSRVIDILKKMIIWEFSIILSRCLFRIFWRKN